MARSSSWICAGDALRSSIAPSSTRRTARWSTCNSSSVRTNGAAVADAFRIASRGRAAARPLPGLSARPARVRHRLSAEHGGIVPFRLGPYPALLLTDPDAIDEVLVGTKS